MIRLLSVADMRESDRQTIENGTDSKLLMYRAGEAIFNDVRHLSSPVLIICGNGNNAGDGYVLATLLHNNNINCELLRITDRFSEDGLYYYSQCKDLGIADTVLPQLMLDVNGDTGESAVLSFISKFPVVVDCIFGTGFHGEVREPERSMIEAINTSGSYIVSVDINSGLNGDSGISDICVHSDLTISIGNMKPGHYLAQAKDVCHKLINHDIGIIPTDNSKEIYLMESDDFKEIFAPRLNNSNKGTYGYIGLIGGSKNYSGAIRLANMAGCAMRSGAGVVKLAAPASLGPVIMPSILESTFFPLSCEEDNLIFNENEFSMLLNLSAIAFGMGIGNTEDVKNALSYLLSNYKGILIIDADGLNALSEMDNNQLKNATCQVILTPHPKEFSRLSGNPVSDVLCKPIDLATEYANSNNVVVLLKGASTVITDGKTVYINARGCAGMATAGSGDALSGVLAAVCGFSKPADLSQASLITSAASYITGVAGELASEEYGDISMIASDTANYLPKAIKAVRGD